MLYIIIYNNVIFLLTNIFVQIRMLFKYEHAVSFNKRVKKRHEADRKNIPGFRRVTQRRDIHPETTG